MHLDAYVPRQIRQHILSVTVAMLSSAMAHGGTNVEFCRGVMDTARAQALGYGIDWSALVEDLLGVLSTEGVDVVGVLEG